MSGKETYPSLEEELELIIDVARHASEIALPYFRGQTALDVQIKSGDSPVSAADYAVDTYLREALSAARPSYGWLSEETEDHGIEKRLAAKRTFVVDPIDGTRGFIQGRDVWCVSIAVVEEGRPVAGVLTCPAREEVFAATFGGGATLNGAPLSLNSDRLNNMIMGGPRVFLDLMDQRMDVEFTRHPHVPSLAYRIAMVATGALSGTFIKPNAHDWDIAAADLILHEAGGSLVDNRGEKCLMNNEDITKPVMIAAHKSLVEPMVDIVEAAMLV